MRTIIDEFIDTNGRKITFERREHDNQMTYLVGVYRQEDDRLVAVFPKKSKMEALHHYLLSETFHDAT